MTMHSRILTALLLAGAACAAGCGDDEDKGSSKKDAGDVEEDSGHSGGDSGEDHPDAGTHSDGGGSGSGEDGGGAEDAGGGGSDKLTKCPDHPSIKADTTLKLCNITASKGNEIKTDLELAPVEGYHGYLLKGVVYVGEDVGGGATPTAGKKSATLTIKPGTVIGGADPNSALAVNRGSKLEAVGTADEPVVFTSIKTLAGESGSAPTDWGGVVLMGRAPQNKGDNPTTELDTGTYGGTDEEDSSGTLKYVRVEFSGSRSSSEKEFNGITFYGVGSGTTVDYIHVHAGSDDAVEFFGGTVHAKHIVVTGGGDDGIDWTDGFRGKIQYAVVQQYPNYGDNGVEADNQSTDATKEPISEPTLANITLIGNNTSVTGDVKQDGLLLRAGTYGHFYSILALNFKNGCVSVQSPRSTDVIGDGLTIDGSRINCTTSFVTGDTSASAAEDLFHGGTGNEVLDSGDVLKAPFDTSGNYDFLPKADSGLLSGGSTPDDDFFDKVDFIGAFGSESWIKGNWVKITDFEPK